MHTVAPYPRRPSSLILVALGLMACGAQAAGLPSDEDSYKGDHIRLMTSLNGFKQTDIENPATKCAPWGTRLQVSDQDDSKLYVRLLAAAVLDDPEHSGCEAGQMIEMHRTYAIETAKVKLTDPRRSGVSFGGLVVPFKFRLGKDKHLVSSSTVAPFVGFRTGWAPFGLSFTPIVALGLSQVPIANASGGTDTKSAYTLAAGLRVTSNKSDKFSAGLILGHDYLNKADRAADATVGKPWLSAYLGYSL